MNLISRPNYFLGIWNNYGIVKEKTFMSSNCMYVVTITLMHLIGMFHQCKHLCMVLVLIMLGRNSIQLLHSSTVSISVIEVYA